MRFDPATKHMLCTGYVVCNEHGATLYLECARDDGHAGAHAVGTHRWNDLGVIEHI